jgi:2-succinyl-5-enolpyruvyl-6-hydroxy-3-cyclohexene-1-carboxylate synthase
VHVNVPFEKPLEPVEPPPDFLAEHPLAATGRPDGAPFVRIDSARPLAADARLDELARVLAEGIDRGVVVAGPTEDTERLGSAVLDFAAATGWPVLADPLSGARYRPGPGAHAVAGYDLVLSDPELRQRFAPSVILRVGATPTSAAVQSWLLDHHGTAHVVVDAAARWKDSGASATHYLRADPADALWRLAERMRGRAGTGVGATDAWRALWQGADAAVRSVTDQSVTGHEGFVVASVLSALPPGRPLFVSSSMPIRDLDAYGHPGAAQPRVFANRGASGIDGIVSSAFGVAAGTGAPTVCVLGDLAFFHDRNGLLWSREADAAVVFVLIDNDGGGIFHMLPVSEHEPYFTPFFATPHGLDPRPVSESHGLDFADVTHHDLPAALADALGRGGCAVLRVRTDRTENRRLHEESRSAVVRAVQERVAERP